jgi:hypothetical protein
VQPELDGIVKLRANGVMIEETCRLQGGINPLLAQR